MLHTVRTGDRTAVQVRECNRFLDIDRSATKGRAKPEQHMQGTRRRHKHIVEALRESRLEPISRAPPPPPRPACRIDALTQVAGLRAHAAEKESGLNMACEENGRLKEGMGMFQKELERLSAENRILKRAVGIQNTKGKEVGFGLGWLGKGRAAAAAAPFVVRK